MSKGIPQLPFDANGNMLSYVDGWNEATVTWKPNETFTARLKLVDYEKGRSRVTLWFEDEQGKRYPMTLAKFMDIMTGTEVSLSFVGCKVGTSYSLKKVET